MFAMSVSSRIAFQVHLSYPNNDRMRYYQGTFTDCKTEKYGTLLTCIIRFPC